MSYRISVLNNIGDAQNYIYELFAVVFNAQILLFGILFFILGWEKISSAKSPCCWPFIFLLGQFFYFLKIGFLSFISLFLLFQSFPLYFILYIRFVALLSRFFLNANKERNRSVATNKIQIIDGTMYTNCIPQILQRSEFCCYRVIRSKSHFSLLQAKCQCYRLK